MLANQQAQQENQLKAQQDIQQRYFNTCLVMAIRGEANHVTLKAVSRDSQCRRTIGIGLYIHRVKTFFAAKNLLYETDEAVEARCLAMVVVNLQGQEAAWYQELASQGHGLTTLAEFEHGLREEFEQSDLQERLRDRLFALQQKGCKDVVEYIEKFRRICTDVQELDKVTFFIRGLKLKDPGGSEIPTKQDLA
ncbi:hypothetical protein DYB38_010339 [Aphanomyces astaci]|uniref:Retrotransposon gag domain-containing protein n=1 Tax=Aphanomyces astaci TaxID=112090 RepID=A0A397C7Q6_APHAT|nr:hypothetical protein DYB38_010339 [Aphanomyces astaci]